jgi:hypothetical protein
MGGKGGDVDMDVDAEITSTNTMEIVGLDDIDMRLEMAFPDPIRSEFAITQPIQMDMETDLDLNTVMEIKPIVMTNNSNVGLDVKPVQLDFCLKLDFGAPPPMCVRMPYSHHFGITLFGVELLGFNFSGESQTILDELPKRPQVAWGGAKPHKHAHAGEAQIAGSESGLRIRFD